jgi:hypothetical protein
MSCTQAKVKGKGSEGQQLWNILSKKIPNNAKRYSTWANAPGIALCHMWTDQNTQHRPRVVPSNKRNKRSYSLTSGDFKDAAYLT